MKKDLSELRKTAEAATPGPWEVWKNVHCDPVVVPAGKPWAGITDPKMPFEKITGLSTAPDDYGRANLQYIATFDPPTVLGLIGQIEYYKRKNETLADLSKASHEWNMKNRADLITRLEQAEQDASSFREGYEVLKGALVNQGERLKQAEQQVARVEEALAEDTFEEDRWSGEVVFSWVIREALDGVTHD